MKKFIFAVSTALLCCCISCNSGPKTSDAGGNSAAQKNLDAAKAVNNAILTGDVGSLDNYIAKDAVDHSGMMGEVKGLDSIKSELAKFHSNATDMHFETVKELADSEYVFQWLRFTGTSASADMGMPVGTKFDMTAIEVSKFNSENKATDHWEFMQAADVMKMMPPNNMGGMKMDSAMKKK